MSVDTVPRGADTYVKEEQGQYKYVGKSPLFVESKSANKAEVFFKVSENQLQGYSQNCEWRWQESLIPNLGLSLLDIAVSKGAFSLLVIWPIEYYNSAYYDCGIFFKVKLDPEVETQPACKRLIILPPKRKTEESSDLISSRWKTMTSAKLQVCDEVIYNNELKSILAYYNIDHLREFGFSNLTQKQQFSIGKQTGATHMAFLTTKDRNGTISIESQVYDIHTRKKDPQLSYTFSTPKSELEKENGDKVQLSRYFHLFPNAITYGQSDNKLLATRQGYEIIDETHHIRVPKLVSGIGIDSIEHPRGFKIWDYTLTVYPSMKLFYDEVDLKISEPCLDPLVVGCERPQANYGYTYYGLLPLMNVGYIFHTPAGAFSLTAASGLYMNHFHDDLAKDKNEVSISFGVQAGYSAFLSDNIYLFINSSSYTTTGSKIKTKFIDQAAINQIYGGIGYFTPTFRNVLQEMFGGLAGKMGLAKYFND